MFIELSFALLALTLGFKHSYDADHLIAVSNILRKIKTLKSAVKISTSWAIGHMITATIIMILLYVFRESVLNNILPHFEKIVGIMLIILGTISLISLFKVHGHKHKHNNIMHSHTHLHSRKEEHNHYHKHMFGIGIVHGLASNDELLLLFTASLGVTSLGGILVGVGIFSIGVILGMITFVSLFMLPMIKINSDNVYKVISGITGIAGISYGIMMIFSIV